MNKRLIIFAREPVPGQVKTRLAASIGNHAAAELYEKMLLDVIATARNLESVATTIYWACEEAAIGRLTEKFRCTSRQQHRGDLGQRMLAAFEAELTGDCATCCVIGSDAPDLPLEYLQTAYSLLESPEVDIVCGPSHDGGYYLLGMRRVVPQLFAGITWSSPDVLTQSMAAADSAGLKVALLPEWQDIDTIEDLQAYQERVGQTLSRKPL